MELGIRDNPLDREPDGSGDWRTGEIPDGNFRRILSGHLHRRPDHLAGDGSSGGTDHLRKFPDRELRFQVDRIFTQQETIAIHPGSHHVIRAEFPGEVDGVRFSVPFPEDCDPPVGTVEDETAAVHTDPDLSGGDALSRRSAAARTANSRGPG